jgi:EF-P beta-lysylation protein EpmB
MREAIRDPVELCRRLQLPPIPNTANGAAAEFSVFAPLQFVAKMTPGDAADPLLRQVMPTSDEVRRVAGFVRDPLAEDSAALTPGLLKKYAGRALLIVTGACAVHCRYCFRRHFSYHDKQPGAAVWDAALECIDADESIEEVLLSGGDPLTLIDETLNALLDRLASIRHVRRLRIHTRLPIVIPERVTKQLVQVLRRPRRTVVMVVHANHPRELDAPVKDALGKLADGGVTMLNQSVLLRGVNDDVDVLEQLSQLLVDNRVMPYYLHQLDRVAGTAHFETEEQLGVELIRMLRGRLPGYAVPRFVREIPGEASKRVLA